MKQDLRNTLRRAVGELRSVLMDSVRGQLESTFGILPEKGVVLPQEQVPPLQNPETRRRRQEILDAIRHEEAQLTGKNRTERAMEIFSLEAAFTLLNRLAGLKVMEYRDLVPECVSRDTNSQGYRIFKDVAPAVVRSEGSDSYRTFLELLFDDVSHEVRVLFDRSHPASHLFPSPQGVSDALEVLNDDELEEAWGKDEVLGWVYQYFTPKELREQVRDESSAPRNTYELAIRNQFYTPDYVVRFLAENTLGRLWWEMNPETSIKDRDYLVYREGEEPDGREPRDPRDLRILDPACGSGHFLHYCYDLLEVIYREAYEAHRAGKDLRRDYPDEEQFEAALPALILRNNLHGIDIDRRAVQLTALSLYLRAKRTHPDSPVDQVHAVHAAPMPGEQELFEGFLDGLEGEPQAGLLRALLRDIWDELDELAGEAGTLLRPERGLRERIETLKEKVESTSARQLGLEGVLSPAYEQAELDIDSVPTEEFWQGLEERILDLLHGYTREAEDRGVVRRLFTDDARHGIAFIDALLREYDVVLMNPPFGKPSKPSKKYIDDNYPRTKNDVYAAFVERGLELLKEGGYLGAITSRTGFFLTSFQKWREEILLEETDIITFADLGHGVLDTAMVETAAYVLKTRS